MSLITRIRRQTAVYWALAENASGTHTNSDEGEPQYQTPVEIDCRWDDTSEQIVDPVGELFNCKAIVYVDRDVDVGGILKLGALDSSIDQDVPTNNEGAWNIRRFEKVGNLKCTEFLRTAYL